MSAPFPPAAAPANDKTTLWGVLGIFVGFCCCPPLGAVFGYLSFQEAKKAGKQPTLAYIAWGVSALSLIVNIIMFASGKGINTYVGNK